MLFVDSGAKQVDQGRVVDRESFSIWRLYVDHQLSRSGGDGIYTGWHAFRLGQIDRTGSLVRVTESRPISQHLALFPSGQVRKRLWTGGTFEGEKAIPVNSRVSGEHFLQLFTTHAFDRVAPKAFHGSDRTHGSILKPTATKESKSNRNSRLLCG